MSALPVTHKAKARGVQVLGNPEKHRQTLNQNKIKQQKLLAKVKIF